MSEINSNDVVLPNINPSSLSGNAADYQSGGKRRKTMKNSSIKKSKGKKGSQKVNRKSKKCWWNKMW